VPVAVLLLLLLLLLVMLLFLILLRVSAACEMRVLALAFVSAAAGSIDTAGDAEYADSNAGAVCTDQYSATIEAVANGEVGFVLEHVHGRRLPLVSGVYVETAAASAGVQVSC
jgi:hypothetical protein